MFFGTLEYVLYVYLMSVDCKNIQVVSKDAFFKSKKLLPDGLDLLYLADSLKIQKYSRLRCLLRVKGLVIGFYLGWSGHTLLIRKI